MRNTAGKELFMSKEGHYIDVAANANGAKKHSQYMLRDRSILI